MSRRQRPIRQFLMSYLMRKTFASWRRIFGAAVKEGEPLVLLVPSIAAAAGASSLRSKVQRTLLFPRFDSFANFFAYITSTRWWTSQTAEACSFVLRQELELGLLVAKSARYEETP